MPGDGDAHRSPCPACAGPMADWRSVPASEPSLAQMRFPLRKCTRCGTACTVGNAAADLHETGAYSAGAPRLYTLARPVLEHFDHRRLSLLAPLAPAPARLLDVGAGRGRFVAVASRAGYKASGIEPSARGVEAAAVIGAQVARASVETARFPRAGFDAVTLWHVLEHVDDPAAALARIAGWLTPGGALLVGVPNLASLQAWIGGERWYHLDVPRHRTHFTATGIGALLRRCGYEVVSTHQILAEHNPFGMWQSAVNRLTRHPSYLYNLLKRNAPLRSPDLAITALSVPLLPLALLVEAAAGAAGAGGTVAVLARRREVLPGGQPGSLG